MKNQTEYTTIREARKAAGLSQAAAAKLCHNIPLRTWENWEGGQTKPTPYIVAFIIEKLTAEIQKRDIGQGL